MLSHLCKDIMIEILNYVDDNSIVKLSETSKKYQYVYTDYTIRDGMHRRHQNIKLNYDLYQVNKINFQNVIWENKEGDQIITELRYFPWEVKPFNINDNGKVSFHFKFYFENRIATILYDEKYYTIKYNKHFITIYNLPYINS